jgi:cytochrome P450
MAVLSPAVLAAALALAAALLYRYVIHPALLSPLARIPAAHPTAVVSGHWFRRAERADRQAAALLDAHRRLGPVVRVEPRHVHLASQDALRVVFHVGRFDRDTWWTQLRVYGNTPNMLTILEARPHAVRRRIMSGVFAKSYLLGSGDFRRLAHVELFDRLLPTLDAAAAVPGATLDALELSIAVAGELASLYAFGTANGLDIVGPERAAARKAYIDAGWDKILERRGCAAATKFLEDDTLAMCRAADDMLSSHVGARPNDDEAASTYPVLFAQLRDALPRKEGADTRERMLVLAAAELFDNLEAARLNLGVALAYLLYEIAKHPATLADLRAELRTLDPPLFSGKGIPASALRALDALPLLNAVVTETLRVRNPVRLPMRRVVPPGPGAVVDGFTIPAGTTVSASALPYNMNEDAFPSPEQWIPERWLGLPDGPTGEDGGDAGEAEKGGRAVNDPRRWFWTFLSGSRMCIGHNFCIIGEFFVLGKGEGA